MPAHLKPTRRRAKLERWLRHLTPSAYRVPLSEATEQLLLDRRRVRIRGWLVMFPLFALSLYFLWRAASGPDRNPNNDRQCINNVKVWCVEYPSTKHDETAAIATVVAILTVVAAQGLVRLRERKLGRHLSLRATRTEKVSASAVLGRAGIALTIAVPLDVAVLTIEVFRYRHGAAPWIFVSVSMFAMLAGAYGIRQALNRPTLAVDDLGLFLDERVRTYDAVGAWLPVFMTTFLYMLLMEAGTIDAFADMLRFLGIYLFLIPYSIANRQPRFRNSPRWYPMAWGRA